MIIILVTLIALLIKSVDFIYLFQTKKYRLDRIMSFILEEDFFVISYLRLPRLPAKSIRNFLILIWVLFVLSGLYFFLADESYFIVFFVLLIYPFIAFLIALSGVQISKFPSDFQRNRTVKKAAEKLNLLAQARGSKTTFIGITGSYGKTTTKELLYQILSKKFKVAKTEKNYNSEIGIAISVLKDLQPDTEYFIAEMGAYKKGEIKAACDLVRPKYGILTGIGNQHLSLFGSKQNLREAKAELLQSLPVDGIAYINMDIEDKNFFAAKTKAKKVFYSLKNPLFEIKTNLSGEHNLQNLMPCIALAQQLGMSNKEIRETLLDLKPVEARLSQQTGINRATILNDSYNSNLQGFILAIETAKKMNFAKKYLLSRGLIELGVEKKNSYQRIINNLNKSDLTLFTIDPLFKTLDSKGKVIFFQKESKLLEYTKNNTDKNTLLVVEGRFEPKTLQVLLANDLN